MIVDFREPAFDFREPSFFQLTSAELPRTMSRTMKRLRFDFRELGFTQKKPFVPLRAL